MANEMNLKPGHPHGHAGSAAGMPMPERLNRTTFLPIASVGIKGCNLIPSQYISAVTQFVMEVR